MRTLFYIGIAVAMTVVVFFGFERTFFLAALYDAPHPLAAPETIFQVHGVIATLWMVSGLVTLPSSCGELGSETSMMCSSLPVPPDK